MPRRLTYLLVVGLLAGCVLLLMLSAETVTPIRGALRSLRPRVAVPAQVRLLLPAAAAVVVATTNTLIAAATPSGSPRPSRAGNTVGCAQCKSHPTAPFG